VAQQLVSVHKVDDKAIGRRLKFFRTSLSSRNSMAKETSVMAKEDENIVGATWFSQNPAEKVSKTVSISDEDWEELDLKAANTIQLRPADEVMYNVVDEETITDLWSRLETSYMTKDLSNKLYLKKQLYGLRMK